MKQEKIIVIKELLITQMNHWGLFPLALTAAGLSGLQALPMWQWIICSLVPFMLFLFRRYTSHFLIMVISHAAIWGCFWLMPAPNLVMKAALLVYVAGYLLYSFYLRLREEERLDRNLHPGFAVGAAAAALLLQNTHGQKGWDAYYVISLVLFMGLFFLNYYLENYLRFLALNESSTGHIPEYEIFRSGMGLTVIYTAAGMLLLLLTANAGWLGQIFGLFKRLLIWLLGFLPRGDSSEELLQEAEQETVQGGSEILPIEQGEPSWIWEFLEKLFLTAVCVLLAAAVVWGMIRLVKYLAARFRIGLKVENPELEQVREVREKCAIERHKSERKPFLAFLTAQERVRRIYRKRILASRFELTEDGSADILGTLTARECGQKLEAEQLSKIYEKARYSNQECTSEDIRKAKG